jgi:hypothetical protein
MGVQLSERGRKLGGEVQGSRCRGVVPTAEVFATRSGIQEIAIRKPDTPEPDELPGIE